MSETALRRELKIRVEAALRLLLKALISSAGTFLFILLMAGLPLLFSEEDRRFVFSPERIPAAGLGFLSSFADGSVFKLSVGNTPWDFRELAPGLLANSFVYTALPGALGLGFGVFLGMVTRIKNKATLNRASGLALVIPDFLVIFAIQSGAAWIARISGIRISLGVIDGRLACLPLLAMAIFPFFFSYRAAAEASRRAEHEDFITCARSRGISEGSIARLHLGAVVIPRIQTELPVLVAFMQGSLFITEKTFLVPGMARFLFDFAFAGTKRNFLISHYQYNAVVLALVCLVASCAAVFLILRLALLVARKVLTHE